MKVIVKRSVLDGFLKRIFNEDRSPRSPRIDFIAGKYGYDDGTPIFPNPEIPSVSMNSIDVDDPDLAVTNTKMLSSAAATIARSVPHGQEQFFYQRMKDVFDDAESRDRAVGFLQERENRARLRIFVRKVLTEASSNVPETESGVAKDLFDLISKFTEPNYVKKTFNDADIERRRVGIYKDARNSYKKADDYYGLLRAARNLVDDMTKSAAVLKDEEGMLAENPEGEMIAVFVDMIDALEKKVKPAGTSGENLEALSVSYQMLAPTEEMLDEDLGEVFVAVFECFNENKDKIIQYLLPDADYVYFDRQRITRRRGKSSSTYYTKAINMQFEVSKSRRFQFDIKQPTLILRQATSATNEIIANDPAVQAAIESVETESTETSKRLADRELRRRLSDFIKKLFAPYTLAIESLGETLDISANRMMEMAQRVETTSTEEFKSAMDQKIDSLGDNIRDDIIRALLNKKMPRALESLEKARRSIDEPEAVESEEPFQEVPFEIKGPAEEVDEPVDFTKNLNALAPFFGYSGAAGLRQWINKYPYQIMKFSMEAQGDLARNPYKQWHDLITSGMNDLVSTMVFVIEDIIPTTFNEEDKAFLELALPDIYDLNESIENEDDDEIVENLYTLGGYLVRQVNSKLFVKPLFTEYPTALYNAARECIVYLNSRKKPNEKQISSMAEGELRKMLAGEVDLPRTMASARKTTRSKLEMYGFTNTDLILIPIFLKGWTGDWIKKGSAQYNKIRDDIKRMTADKDKIRLEIYAAIPEVRKDLEYLAAKRSLTGQPEEGDS
jgi:hypothetical protein